MRRRSTPRAITLYVAPAISFRCRRYIRAEGVRARNFAPSAAGLGSSERAQEACVAVEARVAQGYADDSVLLAAVRHGVALAWGGAQLAAHVVIVDALGQDLVKPVVHVGAGS